MKGFSSDAAWVVAPALIGASVGAAAFYGGEALFSHVSDNYFFGKTKGVSMEPEYHTGDRLVVKRRGFQLQYGDVVVIRSDINGADKLCKRVIGLPGDVIELRRGRVYRNGVKLTESYLGEVQTKPRAGEGNIYRIRPDHVFVLGDNRAVSLDSRCKELGQVPISAIEGVVVRRMAKGSAGDRLLAAIVG